jgi:putative ABC transport system substrate-binding protein
MGLRKSRRSSLGSQAVGAFRLFPDDGGLVSYGVFVSDLFKQAAGYIDRIIKGEQPANIPAANEI